MKRLAFALATVLLLGGCGDAEPTPAEAVPALGTQLEAIDGLIADGHWRQARAALRALITSTEEARAAGDLDHADADRVIAAATRMLNALPTPPPAVTPSPTPTRTATPPDQSGGGNQGEEKSGKGNDDGDDDESKGKGKKDD
ncbi:hypothetical protein [Nocardioides cavernaquae]|uniref:Uncharacterized protein n=1 Tax=Nocardioides cavernaquae TaxID=2321396 RepID=A0A3A5H6Q5_9ACTN|nr:hypothetical protein [Nocardioides cavernaquae]RJS45548.1 hypothetical protein D4739_04480 [Nocardioides cavernaquae]